MDRDLRPLLVLTTVEVVVVVDAFLVSFSLDTARNKDRDEPRGFSWKARDVSSAPWHGEGFQNVLVVAFRGLVIVVGILFLRPRTTMPFRRFDRQNK